MSSGFVPAGLTQQDIEPVEDDKWALAKQQVEAARKVKPAEQGTQEGGKSLYEHLQANKAAKQEAFEEAAKLRNQFRALDDSEIEFLDAVKQKELAKEAAVRRENAEQLDAFRKERAAADLLAKEKADSKAALNDISKLSWSSTKKRRRAEDVSREGNGKIKKISSTELQHEASDHQTAEKNSRGPSTVPTVTKMSKTAIETNDGGENTPSATTVSVWKVGIGLVAYSSDEDD